MKRNNRSMTLCIRDTHNDEYEDNPSTTNILVEPFGEVIHKRGNREILYGRGYVINDFGFDELRYFVKKVYDQDMREMVCYEHLRGIPDTKRITGLLQYYGYYDGYIVTEYIDASTSFFNMSNTILPKQFPSIFKQLVETVSYLHKSGVIHDDLSNLENILYQNGRVIIIDLESLLFDVNDGELYSMRLGSKCSEHLRKKDWYDVATCLWYVLHGIEYIDLEAIIDKHEVDIHDNTILVAAINKSRYLYPTLQNEISTMLSWL